MPQLDVIKPIIDSGMTAMVIFALIMVWRDRVAVQKAYTDDLRRLAGLDPSYSLPVQRPTAQSAAPQPQLPAVPTFVTAPTPPDLKSNLDRAN